MSKVELQDVRKSFGSLEVIHGVDVTIEDGEFVVLVGPSGCGKSTLLRMIGGLERITRGKILLGGKVVNSLPPKERDCAMVFQNYALYPHMTVFDNMGFSLLLRRADKQEIARRVQEAAEILGLTDYLKRYPRQLSGGQRQRVAMGRAIVRSPQVFLFDEPLSNLDAKMRVQMRTEIRDLHQRLTATSIYVTHDQVEAMTMADRIVILNEGIVEQVGDPLEVYDSPHNIFVASFIGSPSMNFIEGTVRRPNGRAVVESADGTRLPLKDRTEIEEGAPVIFGFRPEHLRLAEGDSGLVVKVSVVEPTGSETLVFGHLGGTLICVQFNERVRVRPGDELRLEVDAEKAHVFSPETQQRL